MSFRDSIRRIAPPWLLDFVGERYLYGFGLVIDAISDASRESIVAWMPGLGTPTALPYLSRDREIDRGFQETDAAFAKRLQGAFPAWRRAAIATGILAQFQGYVSPTAIRVRLVHTHASPIHSFWTTLDADGAWSKHLEAPANWLWDATLAADIALNWSRLFPILYSDSGPWGPAYDIGTRLLDDGHTLGSTATEGEIRGLRTVMRKWMGAGRKCDWIVIAFNALAFDPSGSGAGYPDGTWGPWHKIVAGVSVPSRNDDAIYVDGPSNPLAQ